MAIKDVKFTLNGQTVTLAYDTASGTYRGTVSAPGVTSWNANDDHKYHGTVTATDDAGNTATATVSEFSGLALRVLEKNKPTISVSYPSAGAYITNSKPTIKWTVTDADSGIDSSTVSIKVDGGAAITSGITKTATTNGYTCEYTPDTALSEGSHSFVFNVSDNDGNAADAISVTATIDTVPPTLNITNPVDGLITNSKTLTVSGTTNDATSSPVTLTVKVGSSSAETVTVGTGGEWSKTITLTEGSNVITITAKDAAGKTTTITRTVTLDTALPVITAVTLTPNPVDAGATYIISVTVTD
jgi:hypothetical protein